MKKVIHLIDPSHDTETHGLGSDIIPYQLGLIATYTLKNYGDDVEFEIFKFLDDYEKAYRTQKPWLVAISNYFWNEKLGSTILSKLKSIDPDVITVAGGPNYPDENEKQIDWLKKRPEVDFYVYKDGEVPFNELVGNLLQGKSVEAVKKLCIPSVHGIIGDEIFKGPTAQRLRDLTAIPSPYTAGLLDKFFDGRLVPMIQTNRGCPFTCTFCVEGTRYYQKVYRTSFERKKEEVDYISSHVHPNTQLLRISDSNFGMFAEDVEFCEYLGGVRNETGFPKFVYCSAGKNKQERILKCNDLLGGAMRLTASVQSFDEEVLSNVKRSNISVDSLMALADQVADTLTYSYSETMLGIPGDSLAATEATFDKLMSAGIGTIIQHQSVLLEGTEMASVPSINEYEIKSMFRPPQRSFGVYDFLDDKFHSMEIEEIIVESRTMPFDDYLKCRQLFFCAILFYNDRIFGEIHALLRILGLSTFAWVKLLNDNVEAFAPEIRQVFEEFIQATKDELWDSREDLIEDFKNDTEKYLTGDAGFNLSYKYKKKAILDNFEHLHAEAFKYLERYLAESEVDCEEAFEAIRLYSYHSKYHLLDNSYQKTEKLPYDIPRMITDLKLVREGGTLEDLRYDVVLKFSHSEEQKSVIDKLYEFYGKHEGGLTYLLARYPLKRLYREVEVLESGDVSRTSFVEKDPVKADEFISAIT